MSSRRAVQLLYKSMLREASRLAKAGDAVFTLRKPMDRTMWQRGGHGWSKGGSEFRDEVVKATLPELSEVLMSRQAFTGPQLKSFIREQFEARKSDADGGLDLAFTALRVLLEQMQMAECSSVTDTDGVRVEATSAFLTKAPAATMPHPGESEAQKYIFTYRIRIENIGTEVVQLIGRYWLINDANGHTVEIPKGSPGVVGCTPILRPGDCFEYYSGTDLGTRTGSMQGSFQMTVLKDRDVPVRKFDAMIQPFPLIGSD